MFDDLGINLRTDFNVRHPPERFGLFEPVSGTVFLNVEDEEFELMRNGPVGVEEAHPLYEVLWHEAYHCFQTYSTGYLYRRYAQVLEAWLSRVKRLALSRTYLGLTRRKAAHAVQWRLEGLGDLLPPWYRRRLSYERTFEYQDYLEARSADVGESTYWGTLLPGLYKDIEVIRRPSLELGTSGLTDQDVIEGSAFIYGRQAAFGEFEMDARLERVEGPYRRVIDLTEEICGHRDYEAAKAAAIGALRYERPRDAFLPLLRAFKDSGGNTAEFGRQIFSDPPPLKAGAYIGTGADERSQRTHKWKMYDDQIGKLEGRDWDIDEWDLLLRPEAVGAVPPGELGFGIVTRAGPRGFPDGSAAARVPVGAMLLPTGPSIQGNRVAIESVMRSDWAHLRSPG